MDNVDIILSADGGIEGTTIVKNGVEIPDVYHYILVYDESRPTFIIAANYVRDENGEYVTVDGIRSRQTWGAGINSISTR